MSAYEAWRATYQDAEAAAKAAFEQVQGLAKMVDSLQTALGAQVRFGSVSDAAASELRRLHAENQDLRARVQELGEMARENRSKRVIELEGRIAEMEEQMAAIGAGGVEPLRKRAEAAPQAVHAATQPAAQWLDAQTIKHISALSEIVRTPNAEYFADAHNAAVLHLRALVAQAKNGGAA